ncbi:MAG: prepilin peptidase [Synergistaceae bacterium]|jgi:leader peptidase (prepilin peptidase)/N-methyltransferase|nr:prepilin peptidase [Synergistaceae bacterium]
MNFFSSFQVVFIAIFAVLGASLGSFFNVVAHRSVTGRPWWGKERSICESCGKELTFCELIPLVSWPLQRGRCRGCNARISPRYFIVEVIGAAASGLLAWRWGPTWALLASMAGLSGILINSLTDYETGDVFDIFTLFLGLCGLVIRLFGGRDAVLDGLIGAAAGWGIFALIIVVSRGGMGWGDACFMGGLGALLGWKLCLLSFYLGMMAGGLVAIGLMLAGKVKWGRRDSIPLVPCLSAGGLAALLWGPQLLRFAGRYFGRLILPGWPF